MKSENSSTALDLEKLSDDLDQVFESHGVTLPLRIAWATALLGAAHDSPQWSTAWVGVPKEMAWMRQIAKLCAQMLNQTVLDELEEDSSETN